VKLHQVNLVFGTKGKFSQQAILFLNIHLHINTYLYIVIKFSKPDCWG